MVTPPMITPLRAAFLDGLLAIARERFPELYYQLTWASIRRFAARDDVTIEARPFPESAESPGYLLRAAGRWLIAVDEKLDDTARTIIAAHELAHLWAHHDRELEANELIVYDRSPEWYDELREAEADYLAERMVRGPDQLGFIENDPVTRRNKKRNNLRGKSQRNAASQIPLGTRKPEPLPLLPDWLDERDGDAIRLEETAHAAAREDARRYPPSTEPRIAFTIRREAWQAVFLPPGHGAGYSPMVSVPTGTEFEYVECDLTAARSIVEQLAKAGYKRTAVFVRRRLRDVTDG